MADEADKADESAEKAYAAATQAVPAKPSGAAAPSAPAVKPAPATQQAPAQAIKPAPVLKAAPAPKPKIKAPPKAKTAAKPKPKIPAKPKAAAKRKPPAPAKATPQILPAQITKLKETMMAKTPDFTKTITDALAEIQSRAKETYEKGTEIAGDASEFAKGNVEAIVESGKILSAGLQDIGKTYVDEAKSAFETLTADMKEMAAVKSPTELFQLQGKLARRNFDSLVAFGSKNSETIVKLANESMAPISSRMSMAADKISKAA